jgi:hypothetical protein
VDVGLQGAPPAARAVRILDTEHELLDSDAVKE